uniref:TIR domain-containing protein n=1 Tax=Magallana gigas TaxID=29159 RepID=A0A8W8P063_MAGGI
MPVFQQVVLGIFPIVFINLVGAVRFSCSSNPKCTCYKEAGLLFADCENLDLIKVPSFNADVGAINLANNRITKFPANLPRKIVHLDISENSLEYIGKTDLANYSKLQNLTNSIIYELNGPILGINSVKYLDLSNNFCRYISNHFFDGIQNVSYLDLSKNALGEVLGSDHHGQIFRNLANLTVLKLARNRITQLPSAIFRNLYKLEILNLSYNSLSEFSASLENMKRLKLLDLSNNQLSSLNAKTRNTIDYLSKTQKLFVNLGHNKWMCNCENLEFLQWMQFSKNVVFFDLDNFICTYEKTRFRFSDIDKLLQDLEKQCSSYIITIVIMTSLIIVFITTTFWRILYRYRWKLRYMYYVAREKYRDNVQRPDNTGNSAYYFDAFVSYADKDRRFVIELVKRLETDHNLKLCIHHRDFIPGTGVADNITNAIHNSRRTVAIMTSHFLESYWCMFELNMARMEEIYSRNGENVSFLVVLEKLAIAKIPFSFMDLIENRSYLEYPENEDKDEVSAFRSKLAGTLRMRESDFRTSSSITTQLE